MKLIYTVLAALGLIGALALSGTAEAASCASARVLIYNSASPTYSIQLSTSGFGSKTFERLESGVPTETIVASSYTWKQTNSAPLTVDTTFRITSSSCIAEYNPPDGPGIWYLNGPI
jgi:hypothetical protein